MAFMAVRVSSRSGAIARVSIPADLALRRAWRPRACSLIDVVRTAMTIAAAAGFVTPASPAPSAVPGGLAAPRDMTAVGGIEFARLAGVADLHVESSIVAAD